MNIGWAIFNSLLKRMKKYKIKAPKAAGFTLAELLISLAILGVIATFTIPKVLTSQQDEAWNSAAKEAAGALTNALAAYRLDNSGSLDIRISDIAQYLNYVERQTSGLIDASQTLGSWPCNNLDHHCYVLHNGGILAPDADHRLRDTDGNLAASYYYFDPDGVYSGNTSGPGKSIQLWIYANGRITTRGDLVPNTQHRVNAVTVQSTNPEPTYEPPWFSW